MKKRDNSLNKILYTLLVLCVFIIMGMGVFIVNAYGGSSPSVMWHSAGEIDWSDSISSLKTDSLEAGSINLGGVSKTSWPTDGITSETDPTVLASVKDGVSWAEITSKPAGFADGVDNVGSVSVTCSCGTCWETKSEYLPSGSWWVDGRNKISICTPAGWRTTQICVC